MLVLSNVCKRFGTRSILEAVDLQVRTGEYVAIVGESGSGKSTLLNLIAGLDLPDTGSIDIDGQSLTQLAEDARTRLRRTRVGFVFQAFHILPHLTLAQNVELPLVLLGIEEDERTRRVRAMVTAVGLAGRETSLPREFSGGELQRIALARALVHRPALLLADEPTGNLDPDTADSVLRLLATTIRTHRAAGILVTHSVHAAQTADRIVRLEHGRLLPA